MFTRSRYCGDLRPEHTGERVRLCGWVDRRRDHGGVIFLDLRDRSGVVQLVFDPDAGEHFHRAEQVRGEFVLWAEGTVRLRSEDTRNPKMPTGEVEVLGASLEILNTAETPPFQLDEYIEAGEELRLRHRYLDLRRPAMQGGLLLRARLLSLLRKALEREGFWEVETPALTRATPEGARDYLVPSRLDPGTFYALPQSPQLFKQLLMIGGIDRYFQAARCFRDEDLRADRQPEFTQIDIEASFVDEEAIMEITERILREAFSELLGEELPAFPRMEYAEAMRRFGSDCPDLRNPLELVEISELMREVEFNIFRQAARDADSRLAVLRVPGGGAMSRAEIDACTEFVAEFGAGGLAWIRVNDRSAGIRGLQSPILKFIPAEQTLALLACCAAESGDLLFFGAGPIATVNQSLGALRDRLGAERGLLRAGWAPLWVHSFPMFERDEAGGFMALHHPFTAPQTEDPQAVQQDPGAQLSRAYDVVLNGHEIGGGSVRIHKPEMQRTVLQVLGFERAEAEQRFGFLLEALRYGAPPHGGIALGLDRLAMLFSGAGSIREVIAFPKTQSGSCPLTGAPREVEAERLRELRLRLQARGAR